MTQDEEFEAWWAKLQINDYKSNAMTEAARLAWNEAKQRSSFYYKVLNSQASKN